MVVIFCNILRKPLPRINPISASLHPLIKKTVGSDCSGTPFGEAKTTARPKRFQQHRGTQNKKINLPCTRATPLHLGQTFSAYAAQKRPHKKVRPINTKFAL
jgi:hypothetical protein